MRFTDFLKACECDSRGRTGLGNCELPEAAMLQKALQAASSIDAGAIAQQFSQPEKIKTAVFEARLESLKQAI
jgi:tRNA nucleotidyltransferase (CCA-adding enzyme)